MEELYRKYVFTQFGGFYEVVLIKHDLGFYSVHTVQGTEIDLTNQGYLDFQSAFKAFKQR